MKVPSNNDQEVIKTEHNVVASAKNIFSVAKNAIGNLTSFMSKKNLDNLNADEK